MKAFLAISAEDITGDPKPITYEAEEDLRMIHLERRLVQLFARCGIHVDRLCFKTPDGEGGFEKVHSMTRIGDLDSYKFIMQHPEPPEKKRMKLMIPRPAVPTIPEETPLEAVCKKCGQGFKKMREFHNCDVCSNKLDLDY